jgi:hypothetical protein
MGPGPVVVGWPVAGEAVGPWAAVVVWYGLTTFGLCSLPLNNFGSKPPGLGWAVVSGARVTRAGPEVAGADWVPTMIWGLVCIVGGVPLGVVWITGPWATMVGCLVVGEPSCP